MIYNCSHHDSSTLVLVQCFHRVYGQILIDILLYHCLNKLNVCTSLIITYLFFTYRWKGYNPKTIHCIIFFLYCSCPCFLLNIGDMLVLYEVVIFCRIIEPLASRCAKFRFKPLTEEIMSNRILYICNEEGIHLDAEVVVLVVVLFVMVLILCL
jgi:hypothetical protein